MTQEGYERALRFQAATLGLVRARALRDATRDEALRELLAVGADTLGVERAEVWVFADDGRALRMVLGYARSALAFDAGEARAGDACRAWLDALARQEVVQVHDATSDARVFGPHTAARLDVPLRLDGRLAAVLVLEHATGARRWTLDETRFALELGAFATLVLEREAERARHAAHVLTRATVVPDDPRAVERERVLFTLNPQGIGIGALRHPVPASLPRAERVRRILEEAYIADANPAYAHLYGFDTREAVIGQSLPAILGSVEAAEALLTSGPSELERQDWVRRVRIRGGRSRWLLGNTVAVLEGDLVLGWYATVTDITETKRNEEVLLHLASATTDTGDAFFDGLARGIAEALEVDVALVAELAPDGLARTLALWEHGALGATRTFALEGSPWAAVARGEVCVVASGGRERAGADALDSARGAESWLAVPLLGSGDAPSGLVLALHGERMHDATSNELVLRLFARRAEAELARARAEASLRQAQARLEEALSRSHRRVVELEEEAGEASDVPGMFGRSVAMRQVARRLRQAAQSDVTVLVTGPTGTGKELAARAIHALGARAKRPFVAINCVELPETLLESELFGHVRGAFTGAQKDKAGLFQAADGGTLFLDEIGELTPAVQAKLLRVLQERQVRRVGDQRPIAVDVRLVCATHRDLAAMIRTGQFREDLYFRIHVFEIALPPLAERKGDLPLLVAGFLEELARAHHKRLRGIDAEAMGALERHTWPGNVRELRNAIEHAVVAASHDHVRLEDLPAALHAPASPRPATLSPEDQALRRRIVAALEAHGGHRDRAARALGISRVTLWKKMKALGLGDDEPGR